MSFNRENVIWESEDGSWNRGFFYVRWTGDDPEWDVEYDFDAFEWVSTGHPDERAAHASWQGANPGGGYVVSYEGNEDECAQYDEMAQECGESENSWW
jgi:hypothetical protein